MLVARLLAAAALAIVLLVPSAAARPASEILRVDDIGQGARESWIFFPGEAAPKCVVVFLHGAGDRSPVRYRGWLSYLSIGRGCAAIYPRYQPSGEEPLSAASLKALRGAIGASVAHLRASRYGLYRDRAPTDLPLVVVGIGEGGVLAMYYAANARSWGLPVPAAVDSVFPFAHAIPNVPLGTPEPRTRVLIQVGSRDGAGKAGGDYLWKALAAHPASRKRLQVVPAGKSGPLQLTVAAQNAFWVPLDRLIDGGFGG